LLSPEPFGDDLDTLNSDSYSFGVKLSIPQNIESIGIKFLQ